MGSAAPKFQQGKTYTFRDLKFYAMNGMICLHDEKDGDFRVLTCREWAYRTEAIGDEIKRLAVMQAENPSKRDLGEMRREYQQAVDDMILCYADAKTQGDHTDPEVEAWFRRHRPWARGRTKSPSRHADFEANRPSAKLPRGRFTGRTASSGQRLDDLRRTTAGAQIVGRPQPRRKLILPDNVL